jgi:excisionase family DNA binding protein
MENPFELILERLDRIEKAIQNLNNVGDKTSENQIMDIDEVAAYIKVAKATVYGMTHQDILPYYKSGKKLYFKKDEIDEWVFSHRNKTREEIEKSASEYIRKNPLGF